MSNDSHKERCLQKMQRAIDDAIRLDFKLETALFEFARYKPGNWRELDDRTSQLRHSISELSNAIDVCMLLFKHKFKLLQNLELLPNNNSTQPSTQLADKIKMLRQALERKQATFRKTCLQHKLTMDSKDEQKIRSELLSGGSLTEQQRRNEIEKRSSTKLAKDITEIMRRTNRQMAVELERSQLTLRSLSESTQVMKRTHDEYKGELGSALKTAQQSLTKLFRRDMTDRILLFLSVSVFIAVVLYILKARLYG